MAVRYLWPFTLNKCDLGPKLDLNRRYVLKKWSLSGAEAIMPLVDEMFFYLRMTAF